MGSIFKLRDENGNVFDVTAIRGASIYDLAVKNGFEGSVDDWLKTLKFVAAEAIDEEMSDDSDNLVTNKVIKAYIDKLYLKSISESLMPLILAGDVSMTQDDYETTISFCISDDEVGVNTIEDIRRVVIKRIDGNTTDVTDFTMSIDITKNTDGTYNLSYVNVYTADGKVDVYQFTYPINTGDLTEKATISYNPYNRDVYIRITTADIRLYNTASDFSIECYH